MPRVVGCILTGRYFAGLRNIMNINEVQRSNGVTRRNLVVEGVLDIIPCVFFWHASPIPSPLMSVWLVFTVSRQLSLSSVTPVIIKITHLLQFLWGFQWLLWRIVRG